MPTMPSKKGIKDVGYDQAHANNANWGHYKCKGLSPGRIPYHERAEITGISKLRWSDKVLISK